MRMSAISWAVCSNRGATSFKDPQCVHNRLTTSRRVGDRVRRPLLIDRYWLSATDAAGRL